MLLNTNPLLQELIPEYMANSNHGIDSSCPDIIPHSGNLSKIPIGLDVIRLATDVGRTIDNALNGITHIARTSKDIAETAWEETFLKLKNSIECSIMKTLYEAIQTRCGEDLLTTKNIVSLNDFCVFFATATDVDGKSCAGDFGAIWDHPDLHTRKKNQRCLIKAFRKNNPMALLTIFCDLMEINYEKSFTKLICERLRCEKIPHPFSREAETPPLSSNQTDQPSVLGTFTHLFGMNVMRALNNLR